MSYSVSGHFRGFCGVLFYPVRLYTACLGALRNPIYESIPSSTWLERAVPRLHLQCVGREAAPQRGGSSDGYLWWYLFPRGLQSEEIWLSKCLKQVTQARWAGIPEFLPSQQHPVQSASSLESLLRSKAEKTSKFHLIATSLCFKTKRTFTRCAEKNRATS